MEEELFLTSGCALKAVSDGMNTGIELPVLSYDHPTVDYGLGGWMTQRDHALGFVSFARHDPTCQRTRSAPWQKKTQPWLLRTSLF